ncbi:DNA (cytosine-5)-methyltransferase 1 [Thermoflexales bacterium]|nr:DNA (cytosine-5)-methyltransferase 1 [Thermoflexales bacterium]
MKRKTIVAADLFCGAGGTSSGLMDAARDAGVQLSLLAVNHWDIAIATHSANLPNARHMNADLEDVDPREVVPGGKLRVLVASPECVHFSNARGGRPMSKQSRASIKYVLRWVTTLDVDDVLIENVREFKDWGPLHRKGLQKDRPIQARKGEYFQRFISKLRELGYRVEWRVLCAADYGDATTRKRLFIRARKGNKPIGWPEPTHAAPGKTHTLFEQVQPWRSAREILDLNDKGESIFNRKRPLSPNTLKRIYKGLEKFSGLPFLVPFFGEYEGKAPRTHDLSEPLPTMTSHGAGGVVQPYLVKFYGQNDAAQIDDPLPTVTGQGNHIGVAQPYLVHFRGSSTANDIDAPLPTQTGRDHFGVAQPFVMAVRGGEDGYLRGSSIDEPLPALTTSPALAVVEPYLIKYYQGSDARPVSEPMPTITANYEHIGLAQPEIEALIVPVNHGKDDLRFHDPKDPFPTITSVDAWGLAQYLVEYHGDGDGRRVRSIDEPLATQDTQNRFGLAQPFIVKFYKTADGGVSIDDPMPTITGRDRFGLCVPLTNGYAIIDICFRMVKPAELARAHSMGDYKFSGTREEVVKQIGNSVPRRLARALCLSALAQ